MTQYPDEKSNNPYQQWLSSPSASNPSQYAAAQQDLYPPPDGPPPAYADQQPTYGAPPQQGYNPPPGPPQNHYYSDQKSPEGPYDRSAPRSTAPYEQSRGGPAYYPPYQQTLSPPAGPHSYYQSPGAGSSAPAHDRAPSPNGNGGMSLTSFFGEGGTPPSWQRPPPPQFPYNQFPPMCLISHGKDLGKGFPELPPPCQLSPHPFATHDVTEEDWRRFLADMKKAGALSATQRITSNVIPFAAGLSLIGGLFLTRGIEKKMMHKNRTAAGDVVDHWNHYFFSPRRMEVVLCQSSERLSGRMGPAPIGDPYQYRMANGLRRRTSSCSSFSSSSSDSEDHHHHHSHSHGHHKADYRSDRCTRRAERRAARAERRAEKRRRKAERRAHKGRGEHHEPYQLFVLPI